MAESNRELHRRFTDEVFNRGNLAAVDELAAADLVDHGAPPDAPGGRAGLKAYVGALRSAFPDVHFTVEDEIADRDRVVVRTTMRGTQRGDFFGIPASGRPVQVTTIEIVRIANGQIAEHWGLMDSAALMAQIGAAQPVG